MSTVQRNKKALIGMSGGVDSSVAAYLMQQAGYDCIGATMKLLDGQTESGCCSLDDVEDARSVARRLGMPFYVFNFTEDFRRDVMEPFVRSYLKGETPNPCIDCNRRLKFDRLLNRALVLGCDCVVTGHYARIERSGGRYLMKTAADSAKDQTYFLCHMTQEQLAHTQFPLGGLHKSETRKIAEELGLCNARKHDSQDVCFIPDGNYLRFLEDYTGVPSQPGNLLNLSGEVIGRHNGAAGYTLGQRRGLGFAAGQRVYVCGKSMADNTVTLGPESALFSTSLIADGCSWIPFDAPDGELRVQVKTRSRQSPQPALLRPLDEPGRVQVIFDAPQRAVTPGQTVAFYDGELVLGGGIIRETQAFSEKTC